MSVPGLPAWALPDPAPAPPAAPAPLIDPPLIQRLPDGSVLALPMNNPDLWGQGYGVPGGWDDATQINQAFGNLPVIAGGGAAFGGNNTGPFSIGLVRLGPWTYNIASTIVKPPMASLAGTGPGTVLAAATAAPVISSHFSPGGAMPPAFPIMGKIRDLRVDGLAAPDGAVGLEIGGGYGHKVLDVVVSNFSGAGSIGLHLTGGQSGQFTEKSQFRLILMSCSTHVQFDAFNAGAESYEYNDFDFYIMARQSANGGAGVIVNGGSFLNGSRLKIRGNFQAQTGPVITIQGNDGAGGNSGINACTVHCVAECNASVNLPQTIFFGAAANNMNDCTGILAFQFGAAHWTPSNATAVSGQFTFGGVIQHDANLVAANTKPNGWL